jgi:hypothetical protein
MNKNSSQSSIDPLLDYFDRLILLDKEEKELVVEKFKFSRTAQRLWENLMVMRFWGSLIVLRFSISLLRNIIQKPMFNYLFTARAWRSGDSPC